MFILLIVIFFPMLDLLGMGVGYIMSGVFHDYMLRELAVSVPPGVQNPDPAIQSQATAINKIKDDFASGGFCAFLRMQKSDLDVSDIKYIPDDANPKFVECTTTCTVTPFITIPWFAGIPGLNEPFPFKLTSQRPQEETGRN